MVDSSAPVFSRKRRLPRPSRPPPTSDTVNDPLLLTTLGGGGKKPADTGSSIAFMLRPLAGAASVAPLPASAGAGTAAGAPLLRPRSAAAAAGFRRSPAVQAYVDAGVAIKDGVARAFVESAAASAAEHRPLRINRYALPQELRELYVRFVSFLTCVDQPVMLELLDDLWRDALEHRNHGCLTTAAGMKDMLQQQQASSPLPRQSLRRWSSTGGGSDADESRSPVRGPRHSVVLGGDEASAAHLPPADDGSVDLAGRDRAEQMRAAKKMLAKVASGVKQEAELAHSLERCKRDVRIEIVKELGLQMKNLKRILKVTGSMSEQLDLHVAMKRMISCTCEVLDAERATLFMVDERAGCVWSTIERDQFLNFPIGRGIVGTVAQTGRPLIIPDAYRDSRFNKAGDLQTGFRTRNILCHPVFDAQGKIVAVLQAINKRDGAFTDRDTEVCVTLSKQAGSLLRNAETFSRGAENQKRLHTLLGVSVELSRARDLDSVLDLTMAHAKTLLRADRCTMYLFDAPTSQLFSNHETNGNVRSWAQAVHALAADRAAAAALAMHVEMGGDAHSPHGQSVSLAAMRRVGSTRVIPFIRVPLGKGIAGAVGKTLQTINLSDAYKDSRFNQDVDRSSGYKTTSLLTMPMVSADGSLVGVTQMINKATGVFDQDDEDLLGAFNSNAALAIESCRRQVSASALSRFMNNVFESISGIVISIDANGCLHMCNDPERFYLVFGKRLSESIGQPYARWLKAPPAGGAGHADVQRRAADYEEFKRRRRSVLHDEPETGQAQLRSAVQRLMSIERYDDGQKDESEESQSKPQRAEPGLAAAAAVAAGAAAAAAAAAAAVASRPALPGVKSRGGHDDRKSPDYHFPTMDGSELTMHFTIREIAAAAPGGAFGATSGSQACDGFVLVLEGVSREKQVKDELLRFISVPAVDKIMNDRGAALAGTRHHATCLFAVLLNTCLDASGAAAEWQAAEALQSRTPAADIVTVFDSEEPNSLLALVNDFYTSTAPSIVLHHGIVDGCGAAGSGMRSLFGVPFPTVHDATNACRSALEARAVLDAWARQRGGRGRASSASSERSAAGAAPSAPPELHFALALHTGPVLSGSLGLPTRSSYTTFGRTVDVCSMLANVFAPLYGVRLIASERLYTETLVHGNHFFFRELDLVALPASAAVNGTSDVVRLYELVADSESSAGADTVEAVTAFEMGLGHYRRSEWDSARAAFERAVACNADRPAQLFLSRISAIQNPASWWRKNLLAERAEWDGLWRWPQLAS